MKFMQQSFVVACLVAASAQGVMLDQSPYKTVLGVPVNQKLTNIADLNANLQKTGSIADLSAKDKSTMIAALSSANKESSSSSSSSVSDFENIFKDIDTREKVLDTMTFLVSKISDSFEDQISFVNELERKLIEEEHDRMTKKLVKDDATKQITGTAVDQAQLDKDLAKEVTKFRNAMNKKKAAVDLKVADEAEKGAEEQTVEEVPA